MSMLEQAIIDAKELREVAKANAKAKNSQGNSEASQED